LPFEMLFPVVLPRMKQPYDFACFWISSSNVWSFMIVTRKTGEREVVKCICPVMFSCDNVVDLKSQQVTRLRHSAVFARVLCSLPHLRDQRLFHPSTMRGNLLASKKYAPWPAKATKNARPAHNNRSQPVPLH